MFLKMKHTIEDDTKYFDFGLTGNGELLIVRCGSNFAPLLQVVITDAFDFSADNLCFDFSQSCLIFK